MAKEEFIFGVRFREHRCVQCEHIFNVNELLADYLVNVSKTITCPVCGVENVR